MDAGTPSSAVCPECGNASSCLPMRRWRLKRHSVLLVLVSLLVLIGYAWMVWSRWPAAPAPTSNRPNSEVTLPLERLTAHDLAEYAKGARRDGALCDALAFRSDPTGAILIQYGFGPPTGYVQEFKRFGWPTPFLVYRWDCHYADVYARRKPRALAQQFTLRWMGWRHYRQRTDEIGRRETRVIDLPALIGPVVIVFLSVMATCRAMRAIRCVSVSWLCWRRARWAIPVAVGLLVASALAAAALRPRAQIESMFSPLPTTTMAPLGLRTSEVRTLASELDGEAQLAAKMIEFAKLSSPTDVLVLRARPVDVTQTSAVLGGWPQGSVSVVRTWPERSPFGEVSFRRARIDRGWIVLDFVGEAGLSPPSSPPQLNITFSLTTVLGLVGILALLWIMLAALLRFLAWLGDRRERQRMAAGHCAWCGYDLRGVLPTPAPSV